MEAPRDIRSEILKLAEDVQIERPKSYTEAARALARYVLLNDRDSENIRADHKYLLDNLTATQARCTELLEQRRRLALHVEKLHTLLGAEAAVSVRLQTAVDEAVLCARGSQ
jgi:hypothetical protein